MLSSLLVKDYMNGDQLTFSADTDLLKAVHTLLEHGLSGAPVLQTSNQVIRQLRAALGARFPIIGVGGVMSGADARSKLDAGADLVQIYTGLIYKGPDLVRECALALKR